jgi:molybdopterin synthase sulfur carrier subunit
MPQIRVPAALAGGAATSTVEVEGGTVRELLDNHAEEHGPELRDSVVEAGELKEFINVFVDGTEAGNIDETVDDDALVRVMPAASGGTTGN